jgi:cytoskeletal protein CcmA (bactofilin family)
MKKLRNSLGLAGVLLVAILIFSGVASAHIFRTGDNVTIEKGQTVENTIFASGRTVDISSEVKGDVFCAGQNVTVSGTIHGDVICAAQTVHVSGLVEGDVRLAGQTVTVGGEIKGNASVAAQSFNLESSGKIDGDVSLGSGEGTFNGVVGRDVAASAEHIFISSQVGRDIKGNISRLVLSSSASVQGNIDYASNNSIERAEGSVVNGKITRSDVKNEDSNKGAVFGFAAGWFVYLFLAMLFMSMALALVFPRLLHNVTDEARSSVLRVLLVGFLANFLVPFLILLVAITIIGLPLALLLGLLWLVILLLSGPLTGYYIGRLLLPNSRSPLLIMLVGATVLLVLYFIPLIGLLALAFAVWIGSGMAVLKIFKQTPRPEYSFAAAPPAKQKIPAASTRKTGSRPKKSR